jgi:threonine-phosphate decarboxylase
VGLAVNSLRLHGGRVFEAARNLGRHWLDILDFSANINPLGQPRGLKRALFADFERSLHYPEVQAESLSEKLAEIHELPAAHFLPGAGSTPQFHLLARSLDLKNPVIVGPAFAEYEAALQRAGIRARYVLTREEDDWLLNPETLDRLFKKKPGAVFLANPANPTGRLTPYELLLELAEECRRREIWLLLDEAFIDFTEKGRSLTPQTAKNRRLVVFRSLTKIFALPGLRLAFLAAHPRLTARLARLTEPWPLSSLAISAGLFCLSQANFKRDTLKGLKIFKRRLLKILEGLDLGRVYPSEANYVLMRLKSSLNPRSILDHLYQDGILVRDASNFHGLKAGFLRLAVRPAKESARLADSLKLFPTRE